MHYKEKGTLCARGECGMNHLHWVSFVFFALRRPVRGLPIRLQYSRNQVLYTPDRVVYTTYNIRSKLILYIYIPQLDARLFLEMGLLHI